MLRTIKSTLFGYKPKPVSIEELKQTEEERKLAEQVWQQSIAERATRENINTQRNDDG